MEIIFIGIIALIFLVIPFVLLIGYGYWYRKNYKTKEGWHKCWDCKAIEPTVYWTDKWFGRIYRCHDCAFPNTKNN